MGEHTGLRCLRRACRRTGIELHAIGKDVGRPERFPGKVLPKYDLVFACGRSAIEALAVGAAVVLCDVDRLGPMITNENFCRMRRSNFASGFSPSRSPRTP